MKVENNDLVYADDLEGCSFTIAQTNGKYYAFVQVLDLGAKHCRFKKPMKKRYWGPWDANHPEHSMLNIIKHGGPWPDLPK